MPDFPRLPRPSVGWTPGLSSLLSDIRLETGFAFDLSAIFSIIRYRTVQVPIKEKTGLDIDDFEIDRLNLKAKSARIRIYYK